MDSLCYELPSWLSDEENSSHFDSRSEENMDSDRVDSDIEIELYSQLHHSFEVGSSFPNQNKNNQINNSFSRNTIIDSLSISAESSEGLKNGNVSIEHDSVSVSNNEALLNSHAEKFAVRDSSFSKNSDSGSYLRISKKKGLSTNGKNGKKMASIKKETYEKFNKHTPHGDETSNSDDSVIFIESDNDCGNSVKFLSNVCYGQIVEKRKRKSECFLEDNVICIDSSSASSDNSLNERITLFQTTKMLSKAPILSSSAPTSGAPRNGNLWHVDHADLYSHIKQQTRYHEKQNSICSNCMQRGHLTKTCQKPKKVKCYICGGNHPWIGCKKQVCGKCYHDGHVSKHCRYRASEIRCCLCKMRGHIERGCPDLWRRYHLTTSPDTIVKGDRGSDRAAKYCYNCGQKGHFGHECPKPRMTSDSFPTWPFIVSYKDPMRMLRRYTISTIGEKGKKDGRNSQGQYPYSPHPNNAESHFQQHLQTFNPEMSHRQLKKIKFLSHVNGKVERMNRKAMNMDRKADHMNHIGDHMNRIGDHMNREAEHMNRKAEHMNREAEHMNRKAEHMNRMEEHRNYVTQLMSGNVTYSEPYFPRTPKTGNEDNSGSKMKKTGDSFKLKRKRKFNINC